MNGVNVSQLSGPSASAAHRSQGFARACIKTLGSAALLSALNGGQALAQDYTHPRAMDLPAAGFERPDPASLQMTLDNGLVAYVAEDHRVPLVTITAYVGVGTAHGGAGEAAALAAAFRRGPASLPAGEFATTLSNMNAEFSVAQQHEETHLSLDVMAEDARAAMALMAEVLSAPAFGDGASGATQAASSAAIDYSYTLSTAVKMFEERLYAGHILGRSAAISGAEGAQALHAAAVRTGNMTLAVAGDFTAQRARRDLARAFSDLPAGANELDNTALPAITPLNSRELITRQADRIQGWVVIGHDLPIVPLEDQAALETMDYILGAYHLDSRLFRNSRELRGLTNDNSSFLRPGVNAPGAYSFRTYGRPEAVRLLVDITFRELALIRESTPNADELFIAKGALIDGLYAKRYATGLDAANSYAREWLQRGNHTRSASYPERVRAVTAADVQTAAQKYIHPERMIVAVLGPLDKIAAAKSIENEPALDTWGAPAE